MKQPNERSQRVYKALMNGKRLTHHEIPNLSDTMHEMKRRGIKWSSEGATGRPGKTYFMDETDMAINLQNEGK